MSRLRISTANNPLDREVARHVDVASRSIMSALQAVHNSRNEYGPAYVARVRRDLERCLGALESVRRVKPGHDDPDLNPFLQAGDTPPPVVTPTPPVEEETE